MIKRIVPDEYDVCANCGAAQAGAGFERRASDAGDAIGDRNVAQAGTVLESIVSDADDLGEVSASWLSFQDSA